MSEDGTEGFRFGPFMFGQPSEEMQRAMQEARDHNAAHVMDFHHTLESAWSSLSEDQLGAVATWMNTLAEAGEATMRTRLAFQAGSLARMAADRSSKCPVCDRDHDEELNNLLHPQDSGAPEPTIPLTHVCPACQRSRTNEGVTCTPTAAGGWVCNAALDRAKSDGTLHEGERQEAANDAYTETQRIVAEHEAKLVEYRLVQDFDKGGFKCTNCGMPYSSLEDRMLKQSGIEGCPGCINKAKFG